MTVPESRHLLIKPYRQEATPIRRKDASGAPQFSRPEANTNTRCRSGMTKRSTRGMMLSTFMPSKRRVDLVVKVSNVSGDDAEVDRRGNKDVSDTTVSMSTVWCSLCARRCEDSVTPQAVLARNRHHSLAIDEQTRSEFNTIRNTVKTGKKATYTHPPEEMSDPS